MSTIEYTIKEIERYISGRSFSINPSRGTARRITHKKKKEDLPFLRSFTDNSDKKE